MRLRRVVISGFKTFAHRSEVSLEPGITAIVGPNGSGKSNLVDAVRWALGETNARELRGARMDEVIYSGGNGRARMGYAEVELILDNEDRGLAVDDVEVSVSRRVVRHGDSEFRVNGGRVRLRDLERLLGSTGLTQTGYAVVAQNDIDAIIEATPLQRRALIEQAAGVRSLRAACEDALGRVGQADTTLRRFEDLLAETEPRLLELAEQAELAVEQRQLTEQLGRLRGSLAREAWRAARAQHRQAERRLDAAAHRLEAAAAAEAAFATRLAAHRARLDTLRADRDQAAARLQELRLSAERAAGEKRRALDRVRAGVLARAAAAVELRTAAAQLAEREAELASVESTGNGALDIAAATARLREEAQRSHQAAVVRCEHAQGELAICESLLHDAEEDRLAAEAMVRQRDTQLRLFSDAAEVLTARVAAAALEVQALTVQAEAAAAEQAQSVSGETAAEASRSATQSALETARHRLSAAQDMLDEARQTSRASLARAATLRGQVDGALGGRGAVAAAVSAGELSGRRLLDSFRLLQPTDAAAIEAALEDHLGAWIVDDVAEAAALLEDHSAREELLVSGELTVAQLPAPQGARAALSCVEPAEGAGAALGHCLAGAWLVPDEVTATATLAATGGRAVLPDGRVITSAGLRGGGRPGRTIELAAHEHEAAAAADAALASERLAEASRSEAATELVGAEAADAGALDELQRARIRSAQTAASSSAAREVLATAHRQLEALREELDDRQRERGALEGADTAATSRLAGAVQRLDELRQRTEAARARLATDRTLVAEAADALRQAEVREDRAAAENADRARRLEAAEQALTAARLRQDASAMKVLAAELEVLGALARARAAGRAVAGGAGSVAEALDVLDVSAPELAESERAVAALDAERSEVAVVLARSEDEHAAAALEVQAAEDRVAEFAEAVRGDDEDDGPEPQAGDADKAEREIVRLERRVAALGPVNALAPEQHAELATRVTVLRDGRDDLGGACADIRAMASRLNVAIDDRFEAVFGAVSVHFHELFAELFPGGRATLRREAPAAPDDNADPGSNSVVRPGVEILAQPPGKRLQPLSLFSGGERALTALAVILALQQVNPSPFYVFDEVDAPLDDSNVLRFTRMLKRLAITQQFIVVTHNHITMAAADALHGVTSDGDGVSSVISVRFDAELGDAVREGDVVGLRQSTIRAAV